MNKKRIVILLTASTWLICTAWLLRFEAFPSYFTKTIAGYKDMLSDDILMSDSWMLITFNDNPIGFSHTRIESNEDDPIFYYTVKNEMQLKLQLMGEDHEVDVDTVAHLDVMHQLQKFSFSMSSKTSDTQFKKMNLMTVKAIRRRGNQFSAAIISPHSSHQTWFEIPPDTIIHSPMTEMALKKLRPGQTMAIRTLEPTTLSTTLIKVKAVRNETVSIGGIDYSATLLNTEYHGLSVDSWIDSDGAMLKQKTPFGWDMRRCTSEEALNAVLGESKEDILKGMSVACEGTISNPRASKLLKLKLSGVRFTRDELTSPRQTVNSLSPDEVILTSIQLKPADLLEKHKADQDFTSEDTDDLDAFLAPSSFIQSSDEKMRAQAAEITDSLPNDTAKATAIFNWVYKNVRKEMTVSLPSALDVLSNMSGDCNEHTYLFTALARAAGIPAKIKIGLAYHEGSFYYHAWPAVYLGGWIEMDPTWGQQYVDATHLAFVEGELADQLAIVKLLGQLKIEVLEP